MQSPISEVTEVSDAEDDCDSDGGIDDGDVAGRWDGRRRGGRGRGERFRRGGAVGLVFH